MAARGAREEVWERVVEAVPVLPVARRWPLRIYAAVVSLIAAAAVLLAALDSREAAPPPAIRAPEPPRAVVLSLEECDDAIEKTEPAGP